MAIFLRALRDPDDRAPVLTFVKPYGMNRILHLDDRFGVSCAMFGAGHETSYHRHLQRVELFCVRRGVLELHREPGRVETLHAFEHSSSRPGQPHRLRNPGGEPLEVVELFSPPLLDDKVRLADGYGRALGAVTRDR
jgi:mannose-6-phosphate isomerase-like protein (cupin superfamily)